MISIPAVPLFVQCIDDQSGYRILLHSSILLSLDYDNGVRPDLSIQVRNSIYAVALSISHFPSAVHLRMFYRLSLSRLAAQTVIVMATLSFINDKY